MMLLLDSYITSKAPPHLLLFSSFLLRVSFRTSICLPFSSSSLRCSPPNYRPNGLARDDQPLRGFFSSIIPHYTWASEMLAFSFLVMLLFVQRQQIVAAQEQQGEVLRTLVDQTCLQSCYIAECPNLDPACVCLEVATDGNTANLCSTQTCNQPGSQNAFEMLRAECVKRSGELGVTFTGADSGSTEHLGGLF
jgi:hypothetical protein